MTRSSIINASIKMPPGFEPLGDTFRTVQKLVEKYGRQTYDIRHYGAKGDYDEGRETSGILARYATDNLQPMKRAVEHARSGGGGIVMVQGGGEFYMSNGISISDISNLYVYIAADTTLRTTRYTSIGGTLAIGHTTHTSPMVNVGVFGNGTIRNHRPDHSSLPVFDTVNDDDYEVGDYVLSTDTAGRTRAYYCKTPGTSDHNAPPDAINGSSTSGTAVFQDADNDNALGISGSLVRVDGLYVPECSGKFVTVQRPLWSNVWIQNVRGGITNDKGIEVKGQTGAAGMENYYGDGANIESCILDSTGDCGIEAEQTSTAGGNPVVNKNRDIRIVGCLVREAGTVIQAAGIRVNRAERVEVRSKVLSASGLGFHLRLCEQLTGDLHAENTGLSGVHLQENEDFAFSSIFVRTAGSHGVQETGEHGGFVGRARIDGTAAGGNGWNESSRAGPAPVIGNFRATNLGAGGVDFGGTAPTVLT